MGPMNGPQFGCSGVGSSSSQVRCGRVAGDGELEEEHVDWGRWILSTLDCPGQSRLMPVILTEWIVEASFALKSVPI